ncbi:MAG: MauE/DoxX family redox-associated membrane protein [Desulfonatronovibrio sp.]
METSGFAGGALSVKKIQKHLKKFISSPYLALVLRLYIGGIFIYASMYKINYGAEFAETIAGYELAPYWMVNILAITMPWLELICGIMLVVGFRAKSSTVVIAFLLFLFTVGVFVNLLRDSPISCGCFSSAEDPISWMTLIRDVIWLAMCVHIFFFDRLFHLENRFTSMLKKI